MQTNKLKQKGKQPLIKKPHLKGIAMSGLAARRGLTILVYLLISAVLYFFLGQLLVIEVTWLRVLINVAVILAFFGLMYSNGAKEGEGDVAYAEIALLRQQEGKPIPKEELARCFHPMKGFVTVLIGALPLVLLCLAHALIAVKETYTLGALPSWVKGYESRQDISLALNYYKNFSVIGVSDVLRLLVRLLVFPFVNIAGAGNADAILLIERLSPLLILVAPLGYGVGYMRGEHFRSLVHSGIATNARKAARKQRKKKQQSRPQPKQLV